VYDKVAGDRPQYTKPKDQKDADHVGQSQKSPSDSQRETVDDPVPIKQQSIKIPQLKTASEVKGGYGLPKVAPTTTTTKAAADAQKTDADAHTVPAIVLPDRVANNGKTGQDAPIKIWSPPKKLQDDADSESAVLHWKKPKEWFPVDKKSLIPLPTGSPKPIPSVQFKFKEETVAAKKTRETRLAKVKAEAQLAWSGYKQFAWTHDELTPVTKSAKDPFCGWAATLVDSLDTLYIMGLKDEFDDAVKAVKEIDFTTTVKNDIPIFETIIRYLGGLVGAYDVTGGPEGKYGVLLDKALELADVLMSVFDTPNRMPILYYNWQPDANVSPKRAGTSVSVAEIGSMGMEFTRLAQITGEDKFYDAIARITDALEELQNREGATALPGIFPQQLDASGCNRSAAAVALLAKSKAAQLQIEDADDLSDEPQGYVGSGNRSKAKSAGAKDLEFEVKPGSRAGEPGSGQFNSLEEGGSAAEGRADDATGTGSEVQKRDVWSSDNSPLGADGLPADWKCVPQGLTSGSYGYDSYSMGGSQDSAYEYFPKQFALLGGLEPKYRTMHEKTVAAVKKYLLFRPMAENDPDILFSAKATSSDNTDQNLNYEFEITHLSCFLGGMFGLGGKLFDSPEDVEIGKKLADGCVWAYESMPTGIMPEFGMAIPCAKADDCHWNKTSWYETLDPQVEWRKTQLEEYHVKKAEWKKEVERLKDQEKRRLAVEDAARREKTEKVSNKREGEKGEDSTPAAENKPVSDPNIPEDPNKIVKDSEQHHHTRRALSEEDDDSKKVEAKVKKLESELDLNADSGYKDRGISSIDDQKPISEVVYPTEPTKPLSHEEYVAQRLKNERIYPGFASLNDRRYILR